MRMTTSAARATKAECISRAQAALARASAEAAWVFATQGPMAVAEAAHEPGGLSVEERAAKYEALDAKARRERLRREA